MVACIYISQLVLLYILSAKKQATLVQVDVSRVKGVISKETLLTKEISYYCFFAAIYRVWLAVAFGHVRPGRG